VRCGWENRIMSNGESKIAIFKAALCYGFAIALRALFLVIRRCDLVALLLSLRASNAHTRNDAKQNLLRFQS
ncbi:MAG: hypothetical protein K2H55_01285, partial [Helicobacter sp.]|nr:hypothetical protein [Helicobacter sp.]